MGTFLCTLWRKTPHQKPRSEPTKSTNFNKLSNCFKIRVPVESRGNIHKTQNLKRKKRLETSYQKKAIIKASRKLTLEDMILASPSLTPDFLKKSGSEVRPFKHRKKRVHPSSKVGASAMSEAKDSLSLARPYMNLHCREGEERSEVLSIRGSSSGNSRKKVSFKLPHVVILYSPDELDCRSEEGGSVYESDEPAVSNIEDSVQSSMETKWIEGSLDTPEEHRFRLAVYTLPRIPVSSSCVQNKVSLHSY